MSNELKPFVWGEVALPEVIHVDGIPYTTRKAIGEWLEYADPQNAIDVILGRNPYINEFSIPVNLTGMTGQKYETRVYHPMGFLLIVMESGQPKAQTAKISIAAFVWHFAGPKALSPSERINTRKLKASLLRQLSGERDGYIVRQLVQELDLCNRQLGLPPEEVKYLGKDWSQIAIEGEGF